VVNADNSTDNAKIHFVWGIGAGTVVPVNGFSNPFTLGYSFIGHGGAAFNNHLSLLGIFEVNLFQNRISNGNNSDIEFVGNAKYIFGEAGVRLFVTAGVGYQFSVQAVGSGALPPNKLLIQGGLGVQFPVDNKIDLFVQSQFSNVFTDVNFSYIPITIGFNFE
jgi:hypothetical protein